MSISGHPSLGTLAPQLHTSYQRDTPSPGLQELPWHPILLQCPCPAGTDQRFGGAVSGCSFPVPFPELIQLPTQSSPMQVTFAICGMLGSLLNPARGILSCNVFTLDLAKKKKRTEAGEDPMQPEALQPTCPPAAQLCGVHAAEALCHAHCKRCCNVVFCWAWSVTKGSIIIPISASLKIFIVWKRIEATAQTPLPD